MNLRIEVGEIVVEVTEVHPIEHDTAVRLIADLTLRLHRALAVADAEGG